MDLGVNLGYFGMGVDQDNVVVAREADRRRCCRGSAR
jgi:hypothetical protein